MKENPSFCSRLPPHSLAWIAHDLNPIGVVGDAASATAEKGEADLPPQVKGLHRPARGISRHYPLSNLYSK